MAIIYFEMSSGGKMYMSLIKNRTGFQHATGSEWFWSQNLGDAHYFETEKAKRILDGFLFSKRTPDQEWQPPLLELARGFKTGTVTFKVAEVEIKDIKELSFPSERKDGL